MVCSLDRFFEMVIETQPKILRLIGKLFDEFSGIGKVESLIHKVILSLSRELCFLPLHIERAIHRDVVRSFKETSHVLILDKRSDITFENCAETHVL